MSRLTLADLSPKFQAQVAAQLRGVAHPRTLSVAVVPDLPAQVAAPQRIRQNRMGLNKTETAFRGYLESVHTSERVYSQAITLGIANGCRYTPDFVVRRGGELIQLEAYEVKGFMRDDAAIKLKVAASLYPWIKFHLVTKRKGSGSGRALAADAWEIQEVFA